MFQVLLYTHSWAVGDIVTKYRDNPGSLLVSSKIKPPIASMVNYTRIIICPVCASPQSNDKFYSLSCAHLFCKDCWTMHFEVQINQASNCNNYI